MATRTHRLKMLNLHLCDTVEKHIKNASEAYHDKLNRKFNAVRRHGVIAVNQADLTHTLTLNGDVLLTVPQNALRVVHVDTQEAVRRLYMLNLVIGYDNYKRNLRRRYGL